MTATPRGERIIITILGKRNAGKSSLINAITGQEIAIVSDVPGTTTDPVDKHFELLPLGPVTFYDTAGIDDVGELGLKRIQATLRILNRTDIALLVNDGSNFDESELSIIQRIIAKHVPLLIVFNKCEITNKNETNIEFCVANNIRYLHVSAKQHIGINETKELLMQLAPEFMKKERVLAGDLISAGDHVVLVTPIDLAAPKGRLILPQVQVIRELLDNDAIVTIVKERELEFTLSTFIKPPDLVITDSQVVLKVVGDLQKSTKLTTFSILFARYKGELDILIDGTQQIDKLKDGDKILIAEACSHHVQSDDIGRVKIPRWIKQYTGKKLIFEVFSGHDFPENLEEYALIVHCGGCMINVMEMSHRIIESVRRSVPITNYGLTISKVQGVFDRVLEPFRR